ncbi:DUF4956 domain-containing protein [Flavobacteriaceae bacterium]|jgi:hypothetical protein|nr:DUF4956 domain-containing protein [Flavobacteriaceae bacterium]
MQDVNSIFEEFLKTQSVQIPLLNFSINLIITGILAWLLSLAYTKYGSSISNRKLFAKNLILLSITTMVIISIVKSSLALSLGLVGALSIIRFRTAIKEPEELVYLFIAITIGLGLGSDQMATILVAFILIIAFIMLRGRNKSTSVENTSLFITITSSNKTFNISSLGEQVSDNCVGVKLKRYDIVNEGDDILTESVFQISVTSLVSLEKLQSELESIDPNVKISIIDEEGIVV